MKTLILALLFVCSYGLISCTETTDENTSTEIPKNPGNDNPTDTPGEEIGIFFNPENYYVSASGGELLTAQANMDFWISSAEIFPLNRDDINAPAYTGEMPERKRIVTDFYTAETTNDRRIKFTVDPNFSGKERQHVLFVQRGDMGGSILLIQAAN